MKLGNLMKFGFSTGIRRTLTLALGVPLLCFMASCKKKETVQVPHERTERVLEIFDDMYNKNYSKAAKDVNFYSVNIDPGNVFLSKLEEKMRTNDAIVKLRQKLDKSNYQEALEYLESKQVVAEIKEADPELYWGLYNNVKALVEIESYLKELQGTQNSTEMRTSAEGLRRVAKRKYINSKKLADYANFVIAASGELAKLENDRQTLWLEHEAETAIANDDFVRFNTALEVIKRISPGVAQEKLNALEKAADSKTSR